MKYKKEYETLSNKYKLLCIEHDELVKESRSLVNYLLRIKRKCENENLWLMASIDPHKELTTEQQQGPMITKLFDTVQIIKKKIK